MGPPAHRASIHNLLNSNTPEEPPQPPPTYVIDQRFAENLHRELVARSSGLTVEQLEQVNASIMDAIYSTRELWNRNLAITAVTDAFNATVSDIEACQKVLQWSQED
jgi:hypothetical protein